MDEFRIRSATPTDASAIADIHVAAWRIAYRGIMADSVLAELDPESRARSWERNLRDESSPMSCRVVVDHDGRILGFGGTCPPRDPAEVLERIPRPHLGAGAESECGPGELGQLAFINCHPDAFGTGAAQVLFAALEDDLRAAGYARAYLMVAEGNARAMRFYAKQGWTRSEILHTFDGVSPAVTERLYYTELGPTE